MMIAWLFNGAGLLCSFVGSALLFAKGPKRLIGLGGLRLGKEEQLRKSDDPEVKKEIAALDRERLVLKLGFALVSVGFLLQGVAWVINFPSN